MHQLILLRHAKAVPAATGGADHERPLSEDGRQTAGLVGLAMRRTGLAADVVLVSPARRTQETLAALEETGLWDERPNIDTLPALYMAGARQIRDILRDLPETVRSALVIGHNPGLQELAQSLAGSGGPQKDLARIMDDYPTAAIAEFLIATPWHKLSTVGATLQRFTRPKDLKHA